jgi:hypothetical protein
MNRIFIKGKDGKKKLVTVPSYDVGQSSWDSGGNGCQYTVLTYDNTAQVLDWYDDVNFGGTDYPDVSLSDFQLVHPDNVKSIYLYQTSDIITSIDGLCAYTNLDALDFENQSISILDISYCYKLTQLYCSQNNIDVIYFGDARYSLVYVSCQSNNIKSIDLKNRTSLYSLRADQNQLVNIDLTGCSSVYIVTLQQNNLETVLLDGCKSLYIFSANQNSLKTINCDNLLSLHTFSVDDNVNLHNITIDNSPNILYLHARGCKLPASVVNYILITIDGYGLIGGNLFMDAGTNAAPTGAGITAKNNLISKGWSISTN